MRMISGSKKCCKWAAKAAVSRFRIVLVVDRLGGAATAALGDQTWAGFAVDLLDACPNLRLTRSSEITAPIRMVKDDAEVEVLRSAAAAVDRILADVQAGEIPLVGRTEADVAAQRKLTMPLLSDQSTAVLRALRLWRPRWRHPLPALVVFDRCGNEVGRLEGRGPGMRPEAALLEHLKKLFT